MKNKKLTAEGFAQEAAELLPMALAQLREALEGSGVSVREVLALTQALHGWAFEGKASEVLGKAQLRIEWGQAKELAQ